MTCGPHPGAAPNAAISAAGRSGRLPSRKTRTCRSDSARRFCIMLCVGNLLAKIIRAGLVLASFLILLLSLRSYHHGDYFTYTTSATRRIFFSDCCSIRYQSQAANGEPLGLEYDHVFGPFAYYRALAWTPARIRIFGRVEFSRADGV